MYPISNSLQECWHPKLVSNIPLTFVSVDMTDGAHHYRKQKEIHRLHPDVTAKRNYLVKLKEASTGFT